MSDTSQAPSSPDLPQGTAGPTPEEAMAFFQKLAVGKEAELQAHAQAGGLA
jgi:hypothetical protein